MSITLAWNYHCNDAVFEPGYCNIKIDLIQIIPRIKTKSTRSFWGWKGDTVHPFCCLINANAFQ